MAEAGDDIPVLFRIANVERVTELLEQSYRKVLIGKCFAVLERQVAEKPPCRLDLLIQALGMHLVREMQCLGITPEHAGGPAKHIARELVERDQGSEGRFGR